MKKNLGIIFGGKSVEHEISIISAIQAMEFMDNNEYEIIPIYLSKDNKFYFSKDFLNIEVFKQLDKIAIKYTEKIIMRNNNQVIIKDKTNSMFKKQDKIEIDVFFPIVHGTQVEDGKLQGYLSFFNIPIVGPTTMSGAIGQDKAVSKDILKAYNIKQTNYKWIKKEDLKNIDDIISELTYPLIVKPANLGSSIGIQIVFKSSQLLNKLSEAFNYDDVLVIEDKLEDFQELNVSLLRDGDKILISEVEEVFGDDKILSFEDKYMTDSKTKGQSTSGGMESVKRQIPATISEDIKTEVYDVSKKVYKYLRCEGIVRIDLILKDRQIYVNEVNNIPGSLSYYLWESSGITYKELLNKTINQTIKQKYLNQNKRTSFASNVLNKKSFKLNK